jgi:ornithine racemase
MPARVNHMRIGEAAFMGMSPYNNKKFKDLSVDAFEFRGEVIEFYRKENEPDGIISDAAIGHIAEEEIAQSQTDNMSYKAVVDFGLLDVSNEDLTPKDKAVKFVGTTSDMTVFAVDVPKGKNPKYRVGGTIQFKLSYMGVARLMNSKFVTKRPV